MFLHFTHGSITVQIEAFKKKKQVFRGLCASCDIVIIWLCHYAKLTAHCGALPGGLILFPFIFRSLLTVSFYLLVAPYNLWFPSNVEWKLTRHLKQLKVKPAFEN